MAGNVKYFFIYFLVFLLQVIADGFLNLGLYVHLCILPLIILALPYKWNSCFTMVAAFAIGLAADIISGGVPGVNAAAAVLASGLRNPFYRHTMSNDGSLPTQIPSSASEGLLPYLKLLAFTVLVYQAGYLLLDCYATGPFGFYMLRLLASASTSIAACFFLNLLLTYRT